MVAMSPIQKVLEPRYQISRNMIKRYLKSVILQELLLQEDTIKMRESIRIEGGDKVDHKPRHDRRGLFQDAELHFKKELRVWC